MVHELGHFLVARAVGMRASKFSIGFGPPVIKVETEETTYQLCLFPIGGYVQLSGLTKLESEQERSLGELFDEQNYSDRSVWERAAVISAGPLFNFLFAVLVYMGLFGSFSAIAYDWQRSPTLVIETVEGPAKKAGIRAGDVLLKVNGEALTGFGHFTRLVGRSGGEKIRLEVARSPDGRPPPVERSRTAIDRLMTAHYVVPSAWARQTIELAGDVETKNQVTYVRLGISPQIQSFGAGSWVDAGVLGVRETAVVTARIGTVLWNWIRGTQEAEFASIVKMTTIGADAAQRGAAYFLTLLALLSINLGLLNLLPIPALDGGRLVFVAIEAVSGRPVPRSLEAFVHAMGMLVIMAFVIILVTKEVVDLF